MICTPYQCLPSDVSTPTAFSCSADEYSGVARACDVRGGKKFVSPRSSPASRRSSQGQLFFRPPCYTTGNSWAWGPRGTGLTYLMVNRALPKPYILSEFWRRGKKVRPPEDYLQLSRRTETHSVMRWPTVINYIWTPLATDETCIYIALLSIYSFTTRPRGFITGTYRMLKHFEITATR